jgi:ATP-dependent DNA helicase RecQ
MAVGDGQGCRYDFNLADFCRAYHLPLTQTDSALRLLTQAGYILYQEEEEHTSRLRFIVTRDELYSRYDISATSDQVIRTLLRLYSGVFSDYAFISEKDISEASGIDLERLYESLLGLSRARVVHYIPRRTCPSVTFVHKRVNTQKITIPPNVYEERKAKYAVRIEAMKEYVLAENECRSLMLLRYFGEHSALPCRQCDNCRRQRKQPLSETSLRHYCDLLSILLSDGNPHPIEELYRTSIPTEHLKVLLRYVVDEEIVQIKDGMITKK